MKSSQFYEIMRESVGNIHFEDVSLLIHHKAWPFEKCPELAYNKQIFDQLAYRVNEASSLEKVELNNLPVNLVKAFKIFVFKASYYEKYCNDKKINILISPKEMVINHLRNPDYAKDLEKKIDVSLKASIRVNFLSQDTENLFDMEHIANVFPPSHLFSYTRNEIIEDCLLTQLEEKEIDPFSLLELKEVLKEGFQKDQSFRDFDIFDEIKVRNSKTVWTTQSEKTISSHSEEETLVKEKRALKFLIKKIRKNSVETREIAIPTMRTKRSCHIFRVFSKLFLKNKFDLYNSPMPNDIRRRLNQKGYKKYILFDIKKFGWMFPKQLVDTLIDAIEEETDLEFVKEFISCFRRTEMYVEGKKVKLKRGWVLGQFDNMGSYILSCLFELFLRKNEDCNEVLLEACFKGDDSFISINADQRQSVNFWNKWMSFLKFYEVTIKNEKCTMSESGIFCEVYGVNNLVNLNKDIYYLLNFFDSLDCANITHCKDYVNSYRTALLSKGMRNYISMLDVDFYFDSNN